MFWDLTYAGRVTNESLFQFRISAMVTETVVPKLKNQYYTIYLKSSPASQRSGKRLLPPNKGTDRLIYTPLCNWFALKLPSNLFYICREYENVAGSLLVVKSQILNLLNPIAVHHSMHFFVSIAIVWKEKRSYMDTNSTKLVSRSSDFNFFIILEQFFQLCNFRLSSLRPLKIKLYLCIY